MLIDSHCHLDYPELAAELPEILSRAASAGIDAMLTIGTQIGEFDSVRAIAEAHNNIYCSVGTHPHDSGKETEVTAEQLVTLASCEKVVGIGETGLDFYYDNSPREVQERSFRIHLRAARTAGLPVIVHTRGADDETIEILRDEAKQGAVTGVIHCFSVGRAVAEVALELGLFISISGIVTFKNAGELREIVRDLPLNRLLVETDAPFLAPVPHRGKRNEPSFVVHTAELVAELQGVSVEELGHATTENFFRLFTKAAVHRST